MGKVSYSPGIDFVTGALDSTHQLIMRKKHLHDLTGKVDKECDTEAYLQQRKRDYKHNPPQGAEKSGLSGAYGKIPRQRCHSRGAAGSQPYGLLCQRKSRPCA